MKRFLEKELIFWKNKKDRLPLLLRGARQVGKSYLVEYFGKNHFDNVVVVDFERRPEIKKAFQSREPSEIIKQIEIALQQKIVYGKTLLFFDEIQECPEAFISLRYFKELVPELHVIAAGSLMEFLLNHEKYSFPVGRVEFLYLRPFSFLEFLQAVAPMVAERLRACATSEKILPLEHEELLKWVRQYLFVGGMPAAITAFLTANSLYESQIVHQRIIQSYQSDFGKYATHAQHRYLQMIFQKAPVIVGHVLKYIHIDRESRSRDLKPALSLLEQTGLLLRVFATSAAGVPLHAHVKDHRFKLLYLDVGLLQTACQADATDFFEKDILQINSGIIAEQFVGQELLTADSPHLNRSLLFWEKDEGNAEVDYLITVDAQIIPIEVKAGATGSLRSLHSFMKMKNSPLGIRISELPLSLEEGVLSVPFYLVPFIKDLVLLALSNKLKA